MARSRRARLRRKSGPPVGLIVGLSVGGIVAVLVVGLILVRTFEKSGSVAGLPLLGGAGGVFDAPNAAVTEENYQRIEDGMTPQQVEAILGPGRMPTKADFDGVFGEYIPELGRLQWMQNRKVWEENNLGGHVRVWANAPRYMMVTYVEIPNRGRRVVAALYKEADGSTLMMQGTGVPYVPPKAVEPGKPPEPKKRPPPPKPGDPMPNVTVEELLADYAKDRGAADAKYRNRKVKVSGTIDSVLVTMVTFRTTGPRLQARLDGVAYGKIGKKKPGDALTVVGSVQAVFPPTARTTLLVMFENCAIDE
jgi:tRNA_anti-like